MGKRGPKKGHGGRPRKQTDDEIIKAMRKYWRERQKDYRKRQRKKVKEIDKDKK